MRLLVVEDDKTIAKAIKDGLEQESFAVDLAYDGEEGYWSAVEDNYDLIVLDLMLPAMDGIQVASKLRTKKINTPILMLTAKGEIGDKVKGLNIGADDYLTKPFSFDEFLARVRALLRRPQKRLGEVLQIKDLKLDTISHEVKRGKKSIQLSSKEYALLEYMMRHQGMVLSKNNLINHVWDFDADILPNTVEVFIKYLRDKIDKPSKGPALIKTVRGFGYKVDA